MIITTPVNNIPLKPVYLIHGYDAWQAMDTVQKINSNFTGVKKYYFANFTQFIQFNKTYQSEIFNRDLFCESKINKLIEINIGNGKFNKQQLLELNVLINNLTIENSLVVIFVAEKLDKAVLNTVWFKNIVKFGIVIVTKVLSKSSMQSWAINQFKQANLKITNDALIKFINIHQNNLMDAKQSIDKLSILFSKQTNQYTIDTEELLQCIDVENTRNSVFDLQNALASKNIEQIILVLNNLKKQNQEEILILWIIVKEIKNSLSKISNVELKLKSKIKIYNLFAKAAEVDLAIKNIEILGGSNDCYVWGLITDLCLEMAS